MRNVATLLAAASLGIVSLGAAACDDDAADTASSVPPATSSAPGSLSATPTPSPSASPQSTPSKKPKVTNGQVVMIDPDGKKYTRKWIIRNAMMMAGIGQLPSDFCDKSYAEGVKGGGKFPAGRLAFMDACEEGVSLAG